MSTSNNPPFAIGQRVVALKTHSNRRFLKGVLYYVKGYIEYPCGCLGMDIGVSVSISHIGCECNLHSGSAILGRVLFVNPKNFAPYDPPAVEIDEAIIDQAKELIGVSETVAPVKEVVNN